MLNAVKSVLWIQRNAQKQKKLHSVEKKWGKVG